MKISLFTKSYIIKACSIFILVSIIAGSPKKADAGFLNGINNLIASVIGQSVQAEEPKAENNGNAYGTDVIATDSVDPDARNTGGKDNFDINDGALLPDNGPIGTGLESISTGEMTTYIVQEGDTLSEIAKQYDISLNTIIWENNISGKNLKVGQTLNILPTTGVKHIIKKGDTLEKIATKYDADVEDIKVYNGIESSTQLKVGDVIYVPNGVMKAVAVVQKPTSIKKGTSSDNGSSSTSVVSSGYYIMPNAGRITSPYGSRRGGFHYGLDIGAPRGTKVVAAASGTVVETVSYCVEGKTSCGGRYGNYIVIEHSNGTFTRYAHLSNVSVSVGERVSQGERIGSVGNTGHSTGPHNHFQIERANGSTIRPKF